jgi:uncharacterized protein involved in outer membrane biogenesis
MVWLRATLIAVLALAIALSAVAVWLTRADLSFLKPYVERLVAEQTGRSFTIGGEFSLDAGRRTVIVAKDVRLGNAQWGSAPEMVRIGRARVEFDPFSLLDGPAFIHVIEVEDAHLLLEESPERNGNWAISKGEAAATEPFELPVLGDIIVDALFVTYINPELQGPLRIVVNEARQRFDPESDALSGSLSATVNGRPVEVKSDVRPLAAVVAGGNFDFELSVIAKAVTLVAEGHIDDLGTPRRPALRVKLSSPDIDLITNALGAEEFGDGGLDLNIELIPSSNAVALTADGDLAGLQVHVEALADDLSSLRESSLNVRVRGPHFGRLMDVVGLEGLPDDPFQASGRVERSGAILKLSNVLLDVDGTRLEIDGQTRGFPGIDAASLRLRLTGPELGRFQSFLSLPDWAVGPFEVAGSIEHSEGQADTLDLAVTTALANLGLRGPIGDPPEYAGSELTLTASGRDLRALAKATLSLEPAALEAVPPKPFSSGGRLLVSRREIELSGVYLEIEESRVDVEGALARRADLVGSRITVTARGTELEDLLADAAGLDFRPKPFEVTATLKRVPGKLSIRDLLLTGERGNEVRLNAELGLPFLASREAELDLVARGPDVSAVPIQPQRLDLQPLPFEARLRASLRGDRLTVDKGHLVLGEAELDWRGTFDLPPEFSATETTLSIVVPELAALGKLDGEPLPAAPLRLSARASGSKNALRLEDIDAELGASALSGNLLIDVSGPRPLMQAEIHIPKLDVPVSDAARQARRPPPADGRLIPDVVLPLDRLAAIDGTLELIIDELKFGNMTFTQGILSGSLKDGTLAAERLDINLPIGRLQGKLTVRPENGSARVGFALRGDKVGLNVAADPDASSEPGNGPLFDVDVNLHARGTDLRALAASLEGHIKALSDGGRIYNPQLALALGGFGRELLGNLNPFSQRDPYTTLSCVVVGLAAADGKLAAEPYLAIRSDKVNLLSRGFIDLHTERIDFTFNTLPRGRLSVSASELINPYVRVSGTLLQPSLSLDSKGAAVTGGAAALTGGLSLLAQATWKRTFGSSDPCGKALEELRAAEADEKAGAAVTTP